MIVAAYDQVTGRVSPNFEMLPAIMAMSGLTPHTGEAVLVVEDDEGVRSLITFMLEDLGYRTLEAVDGKSALTLLKSDVRIDLLITDIGLPGDIDGHEVAEAAVALREGLKVLFISGGAEAASIVRSRLARGARLLMKPFDMDDLAAEVDELIAA